MDAATVAAGGGLLGTVGNWIFGGVSQANANEFNAEQAALQRKWSGTQAANARTGASELLRQQGAQRVNLLQNQDKWRMEGLRKAGLNPMLAAGNVSAPAPGGAAAPGAPGGSTATGRSVAEGASSAIEAMRFWREVKATKQDVATKKALETKAEKDAEAATATAKNIEETTKQLKARTPVIMKKAKIDEDMVIGDAVKDRMPFGKYIFGGYGRNTPYNPTRRGRR